ncbi:hypothetical protein [Wolbachia endosymbiont of Cardiocondyla obscurior]|uniref:hypothetical protein n=1 Tax=Wolbachia endosymbiont of Cardiocondyla obscurior TaxID=2687307 RepID=UPI00157AE759|nr:hypothetical protein [Wolbachia endosymbiont of Cardiocondyla obscurior]
MLAAEIPRMNRGMTVRGGMTRKEQQDTMSFQRVTLESSKKYLQVTQQCEFFTSVVFHYHYNYKSS